jgi:competence protein ComEC
VKPSLLWKLCAAALLTLLAIGGALLGAWVRGRHQPRPAPQTFVAYLDVGDGDCTLIRTVSGETILLDTGSAASAAHVINVLHRLHIKVIDLLVLSGPSESSIGGVPAVVSAFGAGHIHYVWDNAVETHRRAQRAADAALIGQRIPSKIVHGGDAIQIGAGTFLKVLWPPEHGMVARQDSLVLELDYGATRFLFTGTASAQTEDDLVAGENETLGCGQTCSDLVLQSPRSGSDTGTTAELLRSAAPSVAVISASGGADQPGAGTLHRLQAAGAEIHRTDTLGTIIVLTDGRTAPTVTAERL